MLYKSMLYEINYTTKPIIIYKYFFNKVFLYFSFFNRHLIKVAGYYNLERLWFDGSVVYHPMSFDG